MEFEQGPSYAIYTMLSSLYTPGKVQELLKSMEIPPKINPFGQCRSGQFWDFDENFFYFNILRLIFQHIRTKKFPELLDTKYASFGGKKYKWRDR